MDSPRQKLKKKFVASVLVAILAISAAMIFGKLSSQHESAFYLFAALAALLAAIVAASCAAEYMIELER